MAVTKIWRLMYFLIRVDLPCTLIDEPRHFVQRFRRVSTLSLVCPRCFRSSRTGARLSCVGRGAIWMHADASGMHSEVSVHARLAQWMHADASGMHSEVSVHARLAQRAEKVEGPPVQKLFKYSCYTVTVLFLDLPKVDGSYMVVAVKNLCEKRDASRCDLSRHRGGSSDCNIVTP